jgi:hypothetical protein
MQGAKHGLAPGKGGRIAGSPEGQQGDGGLNWRFDNKETLRRQGALVGSPIGIEGTAHTDVPSSSGRMKAMKRRLVKSPA